MREVNRPDELRGVRRARGLTVDQVASRIGITGRLLRSLEIGDLIPDGDLADRWESAVTEEVPSRRSSLRAKLPVPGGDQTSLRDPVDAESEDPCTR